jgi:MutS-like protein
MFKNHSGYFYSLLFFRKKKKILKEIRENWGKEIIPERDFDTISLLYRLDNNLVQHELVDDKTWSDLNFNDLFCKIDRCISPIGSQYLFELLHIYKKDAIVPQLLNDQYKLFSREQRIREKYQLTLYGISHKNMAYLPYLLYGDIPERPKWYFILNLLSLGALTLIILVFSYPFLFWYMLAILITNLIINNLFSKKLNEYSVDLSFLSNMLSTVQKFAHKDFSENFEQVKKLKSHATLAARINKKIGWLTIDKTRVDELSSSIIEYINNFFLLDLISFFRSINFIKQNQSQIREMFKAIASLDASIAISSWLENCKAYCIPEINQNKLIEFNNVGHPLLETAVFNSISLDRRSCLVTGSNMAGKTTFIKTIAINTILAQTIGVCIAKSASIPKLIVRSSIRMEDNINAHKSYYFQEIEAILDFIQKGQDGQSYLFIIDEIFRGTNTIERISAATSVLKVLGGKNYTLVTTHDLELQELLKDTFDMYHFNEQVENGNHFFDYKLKTGPCSARNAIRLLELKGYPKEIVAEANKLAMKLSSEMRIKHHYENH